VKLILRLYRQHDLDLIALHRNEKFCFSSAIRQSIRAYVKKETLSIRAPGPYNLPNVKIPKQIQIIICFDDKKDKELIDWICGIREGYRNSCVKNLLRGYLTYPALFVYREAEDFENIEANNLLFEKNTIETRELKRKYSKRKKIKQEIKDTIYIENIEKPIDAEKLANDILGPKAKESDIPIETSDEENDAMLDILGSMMNDF